MAEKNYAFIKDGIVIDLVVYDNPSQELLNIFKEENNLDEIVVANYRTEIGGTYDGVNFWPIQPYPSWTKDDELIWAPPVPYPQDGEKYMWDEESTSWLLLAPSN